MISTSVTDYRNIIDFCDRPYASVGQMNEDMVHRFNWCVSDSDSTYFLGDICMGRVEDTLKYVERMNGIKLLVPGNHDKVWKGRSKWRKHMEAYESAGFIILDSEWHVRVANETVKLCHFPYSGDSHKEDRFTGNRPEDEGGWLLCGHVHEAWKYKDRMINVGVDVNDFMPMHESVAHRLIEDDKNEPDG